MILHAGLALAYLWALPPFNWPDEPAHFNNVRHLFEAGGLDVMRADSWSPLELEELKRGHFRDVLDPHSDPRIARLRYEAHQPPLYYAIAALVYGSWRSLTAVKLLNVLFSSITLILTFVMARRLWPSAPLAGAAAVLLVALLPMRCYMAASVSNDVAAEAAFAAVLAALVLAPRPLLVGLLLGVGLLVKASLVLAWVPILGRSLLARVGRRDGDRVPALGGRALGLVLLCSLGVALPWIAYNVVQYGPADPLAVRTGALGADAATTAAFGRPRPRLQLLGERGLLTFARTLFLSWWGVFGWMEMFPNRELTLLYLLLTLPPAIGVLLLLVRRSPPEVESDRAVTIWLTATIGALVLATALYSRFDFQPQGRYLMLAAPAFGLLFVAGWRRLGSRVQAGTWLSLALILLANLYNLRFIIPYYLS